ncbi:MAG: hypothetical protein IPK79_09815 [Vampirovibrionales bacterium]|nr:hypothetical protein [Vampirovibrionales bacterium]
MSSLGPFAFSPSLRFGHLDRSGEDLEGWSKMTNATVQRISLNGHFKTVYLLIPNDPQQTDPFTVVGKAKFVAERAQSTVILRHRGIEMAVFPYSRNYELVEAFTTLMALQKSNAPAR